MNSSDTVQELATALRAAQNAIPPIVKTKTARVQMKQGGTYTYNYADLSDIIDILRPVLMEYGLCFVQDALEAQGGVRVSTRILHTSGEWIEFGPLFLPAGETPQAYGSAITYARRYALTTAFGIAAEEDDDGQAAKPARQRSRASGGSSSGESITPPASSSQRQQGTPPGDNVGEGTARSSLNAGGGEPRPGDAVRGNPAAPSPTTTSGTGAGEAGTAPEGYGEGSDGAVPSTDELATEEDWQTATKNGLTTARAKAIAKGLGINVTSAVDLTRADFSRVINKYLEMKK